MVIFGAVSDLLVIYKHNYALQKIQICVQIIAVVVDCTLKGLHMYFAM